MRFNFVEAQTPSATRIGWHRVAIRFGERRVLDGFDCAVEPGARIALPGPSGCGKSTLLRTALGFTAPAGGSVQINGERVDPLTCWRLRRLVGYLPQEVEIGDGAAREVLYRPFTFHANAALRPAADEVAALLDRLHLRCDILDADVATLSGGENRRA